MRTTADNKRVSALTNDLSILTWVGERVQEMQHRIQSGAFLIIRFNDRPRCIGRVGIKKHRFFGLSVVIPLINRRLIYRRQLPLLKGILLATCKARGLLFLAYRKPIFIEANTLSDQHTLYFRALPHELEILVWRTKFHNALNSSSVIPRTVKEHDFTPSR